MPNNLKNRVKFLQQGQNLEVLPIEFCKKHYPQIDLNENHFALKNSDRKLTFWWLPGLGSPFVSNGLLLGIVTNPLPIHENDPIILINVYCNVKWIKKAMEQ